MKKILISSLLLFSCFIMYAQDTAWKEMKVDENLTILFPDKTVTIDTVVAQRGPINHLKIIGANLSDNVVTLTITPEETGLTVDNPESFEEAIKGIKKGASNTMAKMGLKCVFNDTLIDSINCVRATAYNESINNPLIFSYIFLVNGKMYSLTYKILLTNSIDIIKKDIDRLLSGIHFTVTNIKEKQFNSKSDAKAYKTGYTIGYLVSSFLLMVGIVALIRYLIKRK